MLKFPPCNGVDMRNNTRLQRIQAQQNEKKPLSSLEKIESVAKIASLIIIPIVIALTGWWVQSSVAQAGIKKDYVAMAMAILKDKNADAELVTWASEVIRQNSPTPLSNELQTKIIRSTLNASYAASLFNLPPPSPMYMEAIKKVPDFPLKKIKAGELTYQQVLIRWTEDHYAAKQLEVRLSGLQEYVKLTRASEARYRKSVREAEEKRVLESLDRK